MPAQFRAFPPPCVQMFTQGTISFQSKLHDGNEPNSSAVQIISSRWMRLMMETQPIRTSVLNSMSELNNSTDG